MSSISSRKSEASLESLEDMLHSEVSAFLLLGANGLTHRYGELLDHRIHLRLIDMISGTGKIYPFFLNKERSWYNMCPGTKYLIYSKYNKKSFKIF